MTLRSMGCGPARAADGAAMRKLSLFIAAFIVATGAFWATMLTTPPTTEAAVQPTGGGINVYDMMNGTSLPSADPADTF